MLTNEQIKQISEILKYSYSEREYLTNTLNNKSSEFGESWDTEIGEVLTNISETKDQLDILMSQGEIKREEVKGAFQIEYQEGKSELLAVKSVYNNLLGQLYRLIEMRPKSTTSFIIR